MADLGTALAGARALRKLSQNDIAQKLGVSRSAVGQWESGDTEPSRDNFIRLIEILQIDMVAARSGRVVPLESADRPRREPPPTREFRHAPLPSESGLPIGDRSVPVYGVAMGGEGADFYNNGEVVDYVRRPPGIISARSVYGIYVIGSSMEPRFEEGELVYVSSDRPPRPNDYVVMELHPAAGERAGPGFIKRLRTANSEEVQLEQFNPPDRLRFDRKQVRVLHRIIPWHELLGV